MQACGVQWINNSGRLTLWCVVAESEERLQVLVKEFTYVWKNKKLKVKVSKSTVIRQCGNSEEIAVNVCLDGRKIEELKIYR